MLTRRSLLGRVAAAFAGSLLARLPLAGAFIEPPRRQEREAEPPAGWVAVAGADISPGTIVFLGADGRFYPVGTEAGQLRNPLALAVASTQAKRGEKGIGLIRGIWDKGKPLTT